MHIATAHAAGLGRVPDPTLLRSAAEHNLILLTRDVLAMPGNFTAFLMDPKEGAYSSGIWYTARTLAVGTASRLIVETWLCSGHDGYRRRELRRP
jgi:hypothetical protein